MADSSSCESNEEGDEGEDDNEGVEEKFGVICSAWTASNARRTVSENILVSRRLCRGTIV